MVRDDPEYSRKLREGGCALRPVPGCHARANSMTQLDSEVRAPSVENSCSHRADVGVISAIRHGTFFLAFA
jgi:hypothetical protein